MSIQGLVPFADGFGAFLVIQDVWFGIFFIVVGLRGLLHKSACQGLWDSSPVGQVKGGFAIDASLRRL